MKCFEMLTKNLLDEAKLHFKDLNILVGDILKIDEEISTDDLFAFLSLILHRIMHFYAATWTDLILYYS